MAPPSPSNLCHHCARDFGSEIACLHCGALRPFPATPPDFFQLFQVSPDLELNLDALTQRFYSLSMAVHPDRFSGKDTSEQIAATHWSTLVNRAYQTLKDRETRSRYYLELFGNSAPAEGKIPLDLAETYFELQEALSEGGDFAALQEFRETLHEKQAELEPELKALAARLRLAPGNPDDLKSLAAHLNKRRYLESMLRDLERRIGS